jgi:YHS domain-containing protein
MKIKTIIVLLMSGSFSISSLNAEKQIKEYSLKICLVSDNKLGSMGKVYRFVHEEKQEVLLCCKPCLKKFNKDPDKYLEKLAEAQKEQ